MALVCALASSACQAKDPVDLLLLNGKIVTVDDTFSIRQAVAVRNGRIVAVGGNELADDYTAARVLDLRGRTVVPGFNDTHMHVWGNPARWIDLSKVTSIVDLKKRVSEKAAQLGPGEWITGDGWSEDELVEKRRPQRSDVDEAAPENPVILTRAGAHSAVANSMALSLAGLTRDSPDPDGGTIERDGSGELNGIIRERANIVGRLVPDALPEELRDSFVQNLRDLLQLGITSIIQAGNTPDEYTEWEQVYKMYGEDLPRATVQIRWMEDQRMRAFGRRTGDGNELLKVGAIKVLVDGGFTGPAAYTLEPYKDQPEYRGKLNISEAEINRIVESAHGLGWQLGFHTIGDAAIQMTIDAFERVLRAAPREDHRHYVNHFTVLPPETTLAQMAKYEILIAQQPNFTYTLEGRYREYLDGYKLQHNNPLRTPMSRGIFVALGSDVLPVGPMVGMYAAVTRKGQSGTVYGQDERLTIEEAIRGYTRSGAFITRDERLKGALQPGMLADMAVLAEDILTIDPERIRDVKVDMTILGGKVVYERH